MTDKSKSQRKRRLQLNADEFAPPPNIYDAAEEPRPDDAWVKFYGGETRGGVKRLSPLDDEADADQAGAGGPGMAQHPQPTPADQQAAPPLEPVVAPRERARSLQKVEGKSLNDPEPGGDTGGGTPVRNFPREAAPSQAAAVKRPAGVRPAAPRVEESRTGGERDSLPLSTAATEPFENWLRRWSPWLKRGGSVKVCQAFFDLTHGRGSPDCFTSNSAIMGITNLSRAQCIRNIHYLIEMGFLEELGESNTREAKGTYYRFHLIPRSLVPP